MRDRIYAAQIGEFVRAVKELRETTGRTALTMHEVVSHAWAPGIELPEVATKDMLRKIPAVRRSLVQDEGLVVAPIALSYFKLVKGRVFTEIEAGRCLPVKSAPQVGFLIIDHDSSPKDVLVWQEWVKREGETSNSRSSEARTSVDNATRAALLSELEAEKLLAIGPTMPAPLAIEAGPPNDDEGVA